MTRHARRGAPAVAILASGLSRHGRHCDCPYCRAEYAQPFRPDVAARLDAEYSRKDGAS